MGDYIHDIKPQALQVSKSQDKFFLENHCHQKAQNVTQNYALEFK